MHRIMFLGVMSTETLRYTYRLRPMSADTTLTLLPQHLRAERSGKELIIPYHNIAAVWLSFQPRGAYLSGYRAKIYVRDAKTITLDDTTYASFFTQQRQSKEYRAFVLGLIERVKKANPDAHIMGGRSFWMQMATIIFGAVFGALLPIMGLMTLKAGQWLLGLMFVAFAGTFLWWTWEYINRNRLRNLRNGVPDALLPTF